MCLASDTRYVVAACVLLPCLASCRDRGAEPAVATASADASTAPPPAPSSRCPADVPTVEAVLQVRNDVKGPRAARIADYVPSVWLHVSGAAGIPDRKLFSVPDIEPIDGCHAEAVGDVASFACERGDHPTARVTGTARGIELAVTRPGSPASMESLAQGSCATVKVESVRVAGPVVDTPSAQYLQWAPDDAREPSKHGGGFDPFEGVAADRRKVLPARFPGRCADAGAGSPTSIELMVRRAASGRGNEVVLTVPAVSLRETLDVSGDSCEVRAYPRSGIAVARCYTQPDPSVMQRTLFVDHDELSWRYPYPMHARPDPPPVLLPCHAAIRFVVHDQP
jgi:hypothetical protein